jgi:hypothetical protein
MKIARCEGAVLIARGNALLKARQAGGCRTRLMVVACMLGMLQQFKPLS